MNHCCDKMKYYVELTCNQHSIRGECPDLFMSYHKATKEYGINIFGSSSYIVIHFCPWCGEKLPKSERK